MKRIFPGASGIVLTNEVELLRALRYFRQERSKVVQSKYGIDWCGLLAFLLSLARSVLMELTLIRLISAIKRWAEQTSCPFVRYDYFDFWGDLSGAYISHFRGGFLLSLPGMIEKAVASRMSRGRVLWNIQMQLTTERSVAYQALLGGVSQPLTANDFDFALDMYGVVTPYPLGEGVMAEMEVVQDGGENLSVWLRPLSEDDVEAAAKKMQELWQRF